MRHYIIIVALFLSVFTVKAQFSGGDGSQQAPYQISTVDQLDSIRYFLDSHFILLNDLDIGNWISNHPDTDIRQNGWRPIDSVFYGSLDGQGHTLSGFSINRPTDVYCGLFKKLSTSTYLHDIKIEITDLFVYHASGVFAGWGRGKIENCSVTGGTILANGAEIGGLFGTADSVTALSCWSDIKIIFPEDSIIGYTGGLFGDILYSEIISCHAKGEVHGYYDIGGIAGLTYQSSYTNCFYTGNLTGKQRCGGITGSAAEINVNNCYTSGKIETENSEYISTFTGGLAGLANASNIKNCYSTMDIISPTNWTVGGLLGYSQDGSTIQNCYASGNIEGNSYVGGLFGQIYYAVIERCIAANISMTVNDTSGTRRLSGRTGTDCGLQNNFAFEGMLVNGQKLTEAASIANGKDLSGAALLSQNTYTQAPLAWNFTPNTGDWKMPSKGCLPILSWQEDVSDTADCSSYLSYLSIKNRTNNESEISVYPNPTSDYVSVQIPDDMSMQNVSASIYDITGRLLKTQILTNKLTRIDLTNLKSGVYTININNQRFKVVKK